jgi:error-prone DNA polymerase
LSYVELHASSAFSFLDGASNPEDLSSRAKELEIPAMALLDRDGVYGAPRFFMHTKKGRSSTLPLVGAEVTAVSGVRYALLAETQAGYQNLCRLITLMKLRAPKGKAAATGSDLAEFAAGLIALTGGDEGPLRTHCVMEDQLKGAAFWNFDPVLWPRACISNCSGISIVKKKH